MRPIRLTMQAFGSYGDRTEIDFTKPSQNIFLVTGDTGAGKTTVFDALVFALYGEASSSSNKKDGTELQSQFADRTKEPFVELVFSEGEEIYTVTRKPRHLRARQKGKGADIAVRETVCLILPDGTEYPGRETDKKLEEIVGLTKDQFMQVGMIAQGEFMDLLRASSRDKKEIYRRLFGTGLYQEIGDELDRRKKEMEAQIGTIQADFRAAVSGILVPADYAEAAGLTDLLDRVRTVRDLSVVDMEALTDALEALTGTLEERERERQKVRDQADRERDLAQQRLHEAKGLLQLFVQLENAQRALAESAAKDADMKEKRALEGRIRAAWEIRDVFALLEDSQSRAARTRKALADKRALLPSLEEAEKRTAGEETAAGEIREKALAAASAVLEKVKAERLLYEKEARGRAEIRKGERAHARAMEEARTAAEAAQAYADRVLVWQKEADALAGTPEKEKRLADRERQLEGLEQQLAQVRSQNKKARGLRAEMKRLQEDYGKAKKAFQMAEREHEEARQAFLDAQAGILAEGLVPGIPCPVCGATDHPRPALRTGRGKDLTRKAVEGLRKEEERRRIRQEEAAAAAGQAAAAYETLREAMETQSGLLWDQLRQILPDVPETGTGEEAEGLIRGLRTRLLEEKERVRKDLDRLRFLREQLERADGEKERLRVLSEEKQKEEKAAAEALAGLRARLQSLAGQKQFPSLEEAEAVLAREESGKKKAQAMYDKALADSRAAGRRAGEARTQIAGWQKELPDLLRESEEREGRYREAMETRDLSEEAWRSLTGSFRPEDADALRRETEEFARKKAAALELQKASAEGIRGRQKPDAEALQDAAARADEVLRAAREAAESVSRCLDANRRILQRILPGMDRRKDLILSYSRIARLWRYVSGNVPGARMDLETYAQRYYLGRILGSANRRFREMSGGQFELRMTDLDQAADGKNKGLDLMVYSYVTGSVREVRTLSGGESFMAALSLALGMADQIQEQSSAIRLDVMFIDEGFGSLDDSARGQAVRVLQEMAGSDRLIGIISHVTELRQAIDSRLVVTKDDRGSHAGWQIS